MNDSMHEIEKLAKDFVERHPGAMKLAYGGDGTIVSLWRDLQEGCALLPLRNYGLCEKHLEFYKSLFASKTFKENMLKKFHFSTLKATCDALPHVDASHSCNALAEFTLANDDPTSALRFNILVNGNPIVQNVIANGVIFATKLGSTGYFKSVARTIFVDGIGIGFICPTYSMPNIVVRRNDSIRFELARKSKMSFTADKICEKVDVDAGWAMNVVDAHEDVTLLGYDHFMCPDCRKNRNSALVNDNYIVAQ